MSGKQQTKKTTLMNNPLSYYMTNWGFMGLNQPTFPKRRFCQKV